MSLKRPPGPYNYDDDEDYVPTKSVKYSEREDVLPVKEKKHTLDSDEDEEDNAEGGGEAGEKNYDVLRDEDIDGQEDGTLDFEGETRITPFNMKEEMQEGHFDGDGFYHFKKDAEEIKDAWLEDIDWVKIKQREGDDRKYGSDIDSDAESDDSLGSKNKADGNIMIYTEMLEFVKEGETIAKALKRLGGNNKKMSSAQKWKLKKMGSLGKERGDQDMSDFLRLTELANKIMETGNMDIYQETCEMINFKVQKASAPPPEPDMDMFADEESGEKKETKKVESAKTTDGKGGPGIGEAMWELRWKDEDNAEIHGPFTNEKMLQWQESGFFEKGGYVRKNKSGQWYATRRIDFELYA